MLRVNGEAVAELRGRFYWLRVFAMNGSTGTVYLDGETVTVYGTAVFPARAGAPWSRFACDGGLFLEVGEDESEPVPAPMAPAFNVPDPMRVTDVGAADPLAPAVVASPASFLDGAVIVTSSAVPALGKTKATFDVLVSLSDDTDEAAGVYFWTYLKRGGGPVAGFQWWRAANKSVRDLAFRVSMQEGDAIEVAASGAITGTAAATVTLQQVS